jgi:hypothetical protein
MKYFKHLLFALLTSFLLTAGFAKAAESFDAVSSNPQVQRTATAVPSFACIVPE